MSTAKGFTAYFETDMSKEAGNPFFVDTPWGRPTIVSIGDVFHERDVLEEALLSRLDGDSLEEVLAEAEATLEAS